MSAFLKAIVIPFNRERAKDLMIDASQLSNDMIEQIVVHGLRQKANDSYVQKDKTGKEKFPTIQDKFLRFESVLKSVLSGEWSVRESQSFLEVWIEKAAKAAHVKKGTGVKWEKLSADDQGLACLEVESNSALLEQLTVMALEDEAAFAAKKSRESMLAGLI